MAGGYSLGPSTDLVARGRDAAHKASLVSQTSAGQVRDVSLPGGHWWEPPHLCGERSALALHERVSTFITR